MKKNSILAKALVICVLSTGIMASNAVHAAQMDNERGQKKEQSWRKNLTDAQRKEIRSLREASREKTQPLKEQIFVKKQELKALQNATNPDVRLVKSVAEDIVNLRSQIQQEHKNLGFSIDKALGLEPGTTAQRMQKGRKFAENHKRGGQRNGGSRHGKHGNSMDME